MRRRPRRRARRPPRPRRRARCAADRRRPRARRRRRASSFNLDLKASGIESALIGLVRDAGLTGRVTCTGGNWAMLAGDPSRRAGHPRRPDDAPARSGRADARLQLQRLWYAWRAPGLLAEYDAQVVSCSRKLVSRLLVHRAASRRRRDLGLDGRPAQGDRAAPAPGGRRHLLGRPRQPRLGVSRSPSRCA